MGRLLIFSQYIITIVALLFTMLVLRIIWSVIARQFGLWNPEHFRFWLLLPWRPLAALWVKFLDWYEEVRKEGKEATAGWARFLAATILVFRPDYVLLGRLRVAGITLLQPLGFKAERHLAMIAGTGTGKTTFLITLLGLHKGNAFVIDPKGQITKIIKRRRGKGGDGITGLGKNVAVLDPYKIVSGHKSASWNAIDELERVEAREGKDAVVKYAIKFAEAIVPMDGDKPYFPKTAREFLQGLILHVYTTEPKHNRNLIRVRELAARGYYEDVKNPRDAFAFLLHMMQKNEEYDGFIAASGASLAETGKSYGDILSTLRSAMKFLDLPEIREISKHSDFSMEDLKVGQQDVFVCAPTGAIREELANWFRLLTVVGLDLFEKIPGNLQEPTIFAIDEMPSIGYIEAIETSAPVMRSYGVRLIAVAQDTEKLQQVYPNGWRGFLGNADAVYWMGTNEKETAEYLAEKLGSKTRHKRKGWVPFFRRIENSEARELITADQISRFLEPQKQTMIVTRFGKRALRVGTMPYYKELPVSFYDADPEHTEHSARSRTRSRYLGNKKGETAGEELSLLGDIIYLWNQLRQRKHPTQVLSFNDALSIFGVEEPFSLNDLNKRRGTLEKSSKNNPTYLQIIADAHDVLREKASLS